MSSNDHTDAEPFSSLPQRSFARRLASSGLWATVGRVTSMMSVLVNYRLVRGCLPDAELSVYVVAVGLTSLGAMMSASGLGTVLLRRLSSRSTSARSDRGVSVDRGRLLKRVLTLALISWAGIAVTFSTVHGFQPNLFGRPIESVVLLVIGWVAARCTLTLLTESFRGVQHFFKAAMFGGLQEGPLVNLSFMASIILLGNRVGSASQVIQIHLAVTSAVALIGVISLFRFVRSGIGNESDLAELPLRSNLIAEGGKVLVSQLAIFGLVEYETLLVGRYCDDIEVGVWGAIRRLIALVGGPLLLINAAVPSFIAELHAAGETKRLEKMLRAASALATPFAIAAFGLLFFFGEQVLAFFDSRFVIGWSSLCLLAAANIVFVGSGSAGLTLRMTNRQGWATVTTIGFGIAYLFAAPVVIAAYGLWGAAVLASLMICARNLIATLLVRRFLGIWCIPAIDPSGIKELIGRIKRRRPGKR